MDREEIFILRKELDEKPLRYEGAIHRLMRNTCKKGIVRLKNTPIKTLDELRKCLDMSKAVYKRGVGKFIKKHKIIYKDNGIYYLNKSIRLGLITRRSPYIPIAIGYFLYIARGNNNEALYIGKTTNLSDRIYAHEKSAKWWSEMEYIEYAELSNQSLLDVYEIYYINSLVPSYNKVYNRKDPFPGVVFENPEFKKLT